MSPPWGSPLKTCSTCGETYSKDQVDFIDGICFDCFEADELNENPRDWAIRDISSLRWADRRN